MHHSNKKNPIAECRVYFIFLGPEALSLVEAQIAGHLNEHPSGSVGCFANFPPVSYISAQPTSIIRH